MEKDANGFPPDVVSVAGTGSDVSMLSGGSSNGPPRQKNGKLPIRISKTPGMDDDYFDENPSGSAPAVLQREAHPPLLPASTRSRAWGGMRAVYWVQHVAQGNALYGR